MNSALTLNSILDSVCIQLSCVSTGLCALSINNDNCYLAYPGSATIGEVQVFDTINLVRSLRGSDGCVLLGRHAVHPWPSSMAFPGALLKWLSGRADLAKLPVFHRRSVLSSVSTTCLTCGCATQVDPRNGVLTAAPTDGSVEPGDKALV